MRADKLLSCTVTARLNNECFIQAPAVLCKVLLGDTSECISVISKDEGLMVVRQLKFTDDRRDKTVKIGKRAY